MSEHPDMIEGVISSVVFHSEQSGFTVLELAVSDELVTVVGEAVGLSVGEEIRAYGAYGSHPSYGRQFRAESFERILPSGSAAILRYLSGGALKGVGPVLARRIVTRFGDRTLEIMETDPGALCEIRGISPSKASALGEEYRRIIGMRAIMLFLSRHGVEPGTAIAVWKKWGPLSQQAVTEDPFCLCGADIGLPFEKAELIAAELGIAPDAPCRVRGGALYVMNHNLRLGHTCLPADKLIPTIAERLDVGREDIETALADLCADRLAVCETVEGADYYYLPEQYEAECAITERLALMQSLCMGEEPVTPDELENLEQSLGIRYAQRQREAICLSLAQPVMILTGGPGTGKTTTLNGIITLFESRRMKVALAAPTGRAAKRLAEVTGREAKTIHRLLEVDFGSAANSYGFKRNERNPLPADAVIVDEMSMVDARLFSCLLRALRMGCRLVLVGDPDQLPPVGAGNVLHDLIASERIDCIHLEEIFRQAAQSLIILSAHEIVHGRVPRLDLTDADLFFLPRDNPSMTASTVVDLCARRLVRAYGFDALSDIQVIAPSRQGAAGTAALNRLLQEALNPPSPNKSEQRFGDFVLREGDKVMQIKNNYNLLWEKDDGEDGLGVFNGDIGAVEMIDRPSRSILIRFDDRVAQYTFDMVNELELAYAITAHKSQGNEFEAVVIPLFGHHRRLHYRNLLYTAVTRARRLLVMVGQRETVAEMVANDRKTRRYTNLRARLTSR